MNLLVILGIGWLVAAVLMLVLWILATVRRDAGWVDVGWASGIGFLTLLFALRVEGYGPRILMVTTLACLWSFRLGLYLLFNRVIGKPEDGRYQTLRVRWGDRASWLFLLFFQAQGILVVLFSIPPLLAMTDTRDSLSARDALGVVIWMIAVVGEMIADWQLASFRAAIHNRGKTCRRGLWRYSRHPNYFFEWLHWWTYVVIAFGSPYGWLTLFGPFLMMVFLFKITGIPATEAQALASRGEDYRRYQENTSAFVPWFPGPDRTP